MQSDYLKPAPCVSNCFLATIRVFFAVVLIAQTVISFYKSASTDSDIYYISQWNLIVLTMLFITMAIVQLKNARRLSTFKLGHGGDLTKSFGSDEDSGR